MNKSIGFIGAGNMGSSLITAIKKSGKQIYVYDSYVEKSSVHKDADTHICDSVNELVNKSDIVFLCIKPDGMEKLITDIHKFTHDTDERIYISIAAGKQLSFYENILKGRRVIRMMPNMPVSIGYGMSTLVKGKNVSNQDLQYVLETLSHTGKVVVLDDEQLMHATTAVAGSGPAFVFIFISALTDILYKNGMDKDQAKMTACQMTAGSAVYAMNDDRDFDQLVKSISSPEGMTVQGVDYLNNVKFCEIVQNAVNVAIQRSISIAQDEHSQKDHDNFTYVTIYTDGACSGNPGPGGYAAILMCNNVEKEISGYKKMSTNNEMELTAALEGLKALKRKSNVTLYSDSAYLINGFNRGWVENWKKNGWTRPKGDEIKNLDLWKQLDNMNKKHDIKWVKVKGHSDNEYNNRCDRLANKAIKEKKG